MEHYIPREPRQNIFNIFEKGKDFFYFRTALTLIASIVLLLGCINLGQRAWAVYPVVIRDAYGNVSMGIGKKYVETPTEVMRTMITVIEAMFTKTDSRGIAYDQLEAYVDPNLLKKLDVRAIKPGYKQAGTVFDFFYGDEKPGLKVIYTQIDIVSSDFNSVYNDVGYVTFLIRKLTPTVENPSGWFVMASSNLSRAQYFEARRRYIKDTLNDEPKASSIVDPAELIE